MDFSTASRAALERAQDLATSFNAPLHLLHVVAEPFSESWLSYGPGAEVVELLEAAESESRTRLASCVSDRDVASGRAIIAAVWGDPSSEILRYALEHHVDLIVCGTHGRRGWNRALLGSVAERVVRLASCPVMTVRGSDAKAAA